jgi:DNA-binding NtrC family response regulator
MKRPVALVIDRDPATRDQIRNAFDHLGLDTLTATTATDIATALRDPRVRIVVAEAGGNGFGLDGSSRHGSPAPILIGLGDIPAAGIGEKCFQILGKPLDEGRLHWTLRAALRHLQLIDELHALRGDLQRREGYDGVVGHSAVIERLREQIERLARDDAPVWFCGETGAGKEHAARELHACSPRSSERFEVLGSGSRGALLQEGFLSALRGGTLYLDDLAADAAEEQAKLVPVLDRAEEVRILAGSTKDPAALAGDGLLLEALRKRLAVETVAIPPLRERVEDIPLLARHFIRSICMINELPAIQLESDALALLERQHWPDNVQGLRNALEQAAIVTPDGKIRARDLPAELREASRPSGESGAGATAPVTFREAKRQVVDGFERRYLRDLMERHGGNVTAASEQAGMLRSALQRLLRKYGLKSADFRRQRQAAKAADRARPRG